MQIEEHGIDRQGAVQVGEDLVAERLVRGAGRIPGRGREGCQSLRHLPSPCLGPLAPVDERQGEQPGLIAVVAAPIQHRAREQIETGGYRREGVRLGAETRGEDSTGHGLTLGLVRCAPLYTLD